MKQLRSGDRTSRRRNTPKKKPLGRVREAAVAPYGLEAEEPVIRDFVPAEGTLTIETAGRRERYVRERSAGQILAMADYLRARRGFPNDREMAAALQVPAARLSAWKRGAETPADADAQILAHLAVVVLELSEFLERDVIPDWLATEQFGLGGRTPVASLREGRLMDVLQAANATEHGAFV